LVCLGQGMGWRHNYSENKSISGEKMSEVDDDFYILEKSCPDCGHDTLVEVGDYKEFEQCTNPDCDYNDINILEED